MPRKEFAPNGAQTPGRYDAWLDFVDNTTLHGLRYVFRKRSTALRVVWFLILTAAAALFILIAALDIKRYFAYPISTVIEQQYPTEAKFPAVTICPQNSFLKSKILMPDTAPEFSSLGLNLSACEATAAVRAGRPCGLAMLCCCGLMMPERLVLSTVHNCTRQYKAQLMKALKSSGVTFNIDEFYRLYTPNIANILGPLCWFNLQTGDACTEKDFASFRITTVGKCFTFNSGRNQPVKSVESPGPLTGLSVLLHSQIDESTIGKAANGFQIFVHEQGEILDPIAGTLVGPGSEAIILFSKREFINLPSPFPTKCENKKLKASPVYTIKGCLYECWLTEVERKCGCHMLSYRGPISLRFCNSSDHKCQSGVHRKVDVENCDCPVPCQMVDYSTQVSYSNGFPDKWMSTLISKTNFNKSLDYQRANLAFVQVGFKSFSYERQKQVAAFDTWALLGEIGGIMGLLVGCSMITLFEFLDFLVASLFQPRLAAQRRSSPPNSSDETATQL